MDTRRFPSHRVSLGVQLNQSLRNARSCKSKGSHQETNDDYVDEPVLSEELKVILTQIALLNRKVFVIWPQVLWANFKKKAVHTQPPCNLTKLEKFLNRTIEEKTL